MWPRILSYLTFIICATAAVWMWKGAETWHKGDLAKMPPTFPAWPFEASTPGASEVHNFRGGSERRGFHAAEIPETLKTRPLRPGLNRGVHIASKSSVSGTHSILAASDLGFLFSLQENGTVSWQLRSVVSDFGFHATPAVADGAAYVGDYAGQLFSLDLKTGKPRWILLTGDAIGSSALVSGESDLYASVETKRPNGFILKVNRLTGKVIWRSQWLGEQSHSSPAVSDSRKLLVVGDNAGFISGLSTESGEFRWRFKTGGPVKATPALTENAALVSSWDGFLYAIDLESGSPLWKLPLPGPNQSSVAYWNEKKLGFINSAEGLCRFDAFKGRTIHCEKREASRWSRIASPSLSFSASTKKRLLVWTACDVQHLCVYDAETMKRLNIWNLGSPYSGEAVFHQGRVLISTQGDPGLIVLEK